MPRRLSSHFKRWLLLWRANYKCDRCGKPLTETNWHAHHKLPWVFTRRTDIYEMSALCAECNLKIGAKMDFYDESTLRLGQRLALQTILRRLGDGESHTAIAMATRYGKSDLQRIGTMVAIELRLVCCGISLSPTDFLCDQMNNTKKWKNMCDRFKLKQVPKHARIDTCVMNPTANGEHFLSVTMHLFHRNLQYWIEFGKFMRRQSGLPVLLWVDEGHTNSTKNDWGTTVTTWQKETGGSIVLLTATPERADKDQVIGFEYIRTNVEDVVVPKTRPGSQPEKIRVDVHAGEKSVLKIKAHAEITFGQSWREEVLCHIDRRPFDVDLNIILAGSTMKGMLSDLSDEKEMRRALTRCVRHPIVIEKGVMEGVSALLSFQLIDPKHAMIIFCGNDTDDKEFNKHAHEIEREIVRINPALKIIIATSKGGGKEELDTFAAGNGDVLIVKQMAGLGIDIERLKVGVDLSPVRTKTALIQRMMRIATPHEIEKGGIKKSLLLAAWITPADLLSEAIHNSVVVENGGQATTIDLDLLYSYEKDREEPPEKPLYYPTGVQNAGASDTHGNKATELELDQYGIRELIKIAPEIGAFVSLAELVERKKQQEQQAGVTNPQNINHEIQRLVNLINISAKTITDAKAPKPYQQKMYKQTSQEVWNTGKLACGIPLEKRLEQVNDLSLLKALLTYFEQWVTRL